MGHLTGEFIPGKNLRGYLHLANISLKGSRALCLLKLTSLCLLQRILSLEANDYIVNRAQSATLLIL